MAPSSTSSSAAVVFWLLASGAVWFGTSADYPPPSEDTDGYYSMRRHRSGGADPSRDSLVDPRSTVRLADEAWEMEFGTEGGTTGCLDLPTNLTLCRGIGYGHMSLPNRFGHDTIGEVVHHAASWVLLVNIQCHPDTQIFLCSLFAPVCLDRPVWPCRSLCESVKAGCVDRMLSYGYPWPDILRCEQFSSDNDMCIKPGASTTKEVDASCPACSQPDTYDGIMDSFCAADFVMRIKIKEGVVSGSDLKVIAGRKKKIYKLSPSLKEKQVRSAELFVEEGASCDCSKMDRSTHGPPTSSDGTTATAPRRSSSSSTGELLVMGRKKDGRLVVTRAQPFDRRSTELTRAVRAMRRADVCRVRRRNGPGRRQATPVDRSTEPSPVGVDDRSRGVTPVTAMTTTTAVQAKVVDRQIGAKGKSSANAHRRRERGESTGGGRKPKAERSTTAGGRRLGGGGRDGRNVRRKAARKTRTTTASTPVQSATGN